jgi:ABC-2 type transport system ATP-binding protein
MIAVRNLVKNYRVHTREPGLGAALRSLVRRPYETLRGLDGISFDVARGERVGVLGANGAGKTTTLKILSGLLHATSGTVDVLGYDPRRRDHAFLRNISLVLGQRHRLVWDLPPAETFELLRLVYDVPRADFAAALTELSDLLELGDLPRRPTRELSLGQRMRCELAASLIHRPGLLFLDEPTLGLDLGARTSLRAFVRRYNEQRGATVLLTSHDMDDVVALCPRVIVLSAGTIAYDGSLDALAKRVRPDKRVVLRLTTSVEPSVLEGLGVIVSHEPFEVVLRAPPDALKGVLEAALARLPIHDLAVLDPSIEDVMTDVFSGQADATLRGGS